MYYTLDIAGQLLAHLQATCVGLHDLDVLTLQKKMQRYNIDREVIPKYINDLEDT